ncbi:MAG: MFS transporter [Solirubrobacteraceae bacterium]
MTTTTRTPSFATSPIQPAGTRESSRRRAALLAACVGFFVIVLDTTVVNVALPSIGHQLHAGLAGLEWIVDGYVVIFAALLLSSGTLSDRFGASRTLSGGLIGFTLASAACGLAPSLPYLLAARVLQGAAAAVTLPASLALVRQAFDGANQRARAIAIWTAGGGAAVAAGPVIGGLLTGAIGWRAIFFVNLPVGVVGLVALSRALPSSRRRVKIDLAGQITAVAAVAGLALGVIEGGHHGFGSPIALAALAIFALAASAFIAIERRVAVPMVPLDIFRSPTVSSTTVTGLILNFAFYGEVFVLSLFFQQTLRRSPALTGLMFVPMTALVAAVNLLAGRLVQRCGPRLPLVIGQLVLAGGLLGLLAVGHNSPTVLIEVLLVPIGIGAGLTIPPLTTAFMDDIRAEQAGLGAGVLNSSRQLGSALGVAVFGALVSTNLTSGLHVSLLLGAGTVLATASLTVRYVRSGPTPPVRNGLSDANEHTVQSPAADTLEPTGPAHGDHNGLALA